MEIDVEDQRRLQQQRDRTAEPLGLRLLDIVHDRVGSARDTHPFAPFPEPEEFMRRDEDAQIERFVAAGRLVALYRWNALGLQAPGEKVGDLAHEEIADRAAEDADADAVAAQCRYDIAAIHPGERGLGHHSELVPFGP